MNMRPRIIPCLLLRDCGLVKTRSFGNAVYLGDPVNVARIFSEKEADELIILDIDASRKGLEPNFELISEIAAECFMPVAYGGGIRTLDQIHRLIRSGIEKVILNSITAETTEVITEAASIYGSQAIIGAVDVRRTELEQHKVFIKSGTKEVNSTLERHLDKLIKSGVGELFINSIDRDGMMEGYDIELIKKLSNEYTIPIIACGGAGSIDDVIKVIREGGASAAAAGSLFVFHGKLKGVLINYPQNLQNIYYQI